MYAALHSSSVLRHCGPVLRLANFVAFVHQAERPYTLLLPTYYVQNMLCIWGSPSTAALGRVHPAVTPPEPQRVAGAVEPAGMQSRGGCEHTIVHSMRDQSAEKTGKLQAHYLKRPSHHPALPGVMPCKS